LPILTRRHYPSVLAVGGELKNTICLNKNNYFFLSQHIGDLENIETLEFFENAISHLKKILEIDPQVVACDMHPDYLSTDWVYQQQNLPHVSIQHHHAHIASCMAEKELSGKVIGISLDGTGFGSDGTIWGGEILLSDEYNFKRIAHLKQVPLPGGEKAIKEPWRMLLAYSSLAEVDFPFMTLFSDIGENEINVIKQMINQKVNCPLTSSCGRLFDAVAAICGCRHKVGYEGQAAMQLEALLTDAEGRSDHEFYFLPLESRGDVDEIDWKPLIISLREDLDNNTPRSIISWKFHRGLVEVLFRAVLKYREEFGINRIVLSGGCFQNRFLVDVLTKQLIDNQFNVFYHTLVSPNDSGLALGQAYIAANRIKVGMI
jgi:hydrogenase maturation protein HypF